MWDKRSKIIITTIIWAAVSFLLFLFLSSNLLALNLLNFNLSLFLVPSLSLVAIFFCSNMASILIETTSKNRFAIRWLRILAFSAFAFLLSKIAVDSLVGTIPQGYALFLYVSFSFAGGLVGLSLGSSFGVIEGSNNRTVSSVSKWVSAGYKRNFITGFFLTIYLYFVRPLIMGQNPLFVVAEWGAIIVAVAILYINLRVVSKELYVDSKFAEWSRHVQVVEREVPVEFDHLTFVQERFVNHGIKEPLLVYLTMHIHDLGDTEEQIMEILSSLIYYHDKQPSIFVFPSIKENLERKNKDVRQRVLEDVMAKIKVE